MTLLDIKILTEVLIMVLSACAVALGLVWKSVMQCAGLLRNILVRVEVIEQDVKRIDNVEQFMLNSITDRKGIHLKLEEHERRISHLEK